jgi:hypothetical protein
MAILQMPEIFHCAHLVLGYVGQKDEKTAAITALVDVAAGKTAAMLKDPNFPQRWRLLADLLTKEYFCRRWIF